MAGRESCIICTSRDRDLIESLCATGAYLSDVAHEFGFQERTLRRHEALHSTKQPAVDPLAILRHMRFLQEKADALLRRTVDQKRLSVEKVHAEISVIELSLKVVRQVSDLTGAKKYMDPHVMLPRWGTVLSKLAEVLKDNQPALLALGSFIKDNGPPDIPAAVSVEKYMQGKNGTVEVRATEEEDDDSAEEEVEEP